MAANARNRANVRTNLQTLLTAALVGDGLPCNAVYAWNTSNWQHEAPVVTVASSGSQRQGRYLGSDKYRHSAFLFVATIYVRDTNSSGDVTTLDDIERRIANVVMDNKTSADWQDLIFADGFTEVEMISLLGVSYLAETIMIEAKPLAEPA